jgi:hypothetical protein
MSTDDQQPGNAQREPEPYRVRIPGFISETSIGLGDFTGRAAASMGFQPCGGCARRATALNNWLVIAPWRSR